MATATEHKRVQLPGGDYLITGTLALGTAGASGKEAITITGVEKIKSLFVQGSGYIYEWDRSTQSLQVRYPNVSTTGDVVATPVASGASLSGVTAAPFLAIAR